MIPSHAKACTIHCIINASNKPYQSHQSKRIAVVVPAFTEGEELRLCVNRLATTLEQAGYHNYRILIVVDGPIRETIEAARKISNQRVLTTVLPMNRGKGHALRIGFSNLDEEIIAFLDGDLDIHPNAISRGIKILQDPSNARIGCVYGSKHHTDSQIQYPISRRILSVLFRLVTKLLVGVEIIDSQTGAKVFNGEALRSCLEEVEEDGFLFDLDLLSRLNKAGWGLYPVPVEINYQYSSTIRITVLLQMARGIILLAIKSRRKTSSTG